jgi:hypothetical protein
MKLSSASKHVSTSGRGGGGGMSADHNVARGRGISQQARSQLMDNSYSVGSLIKKPMPMDEDGHKRRGYTYKCEDPWSATPANDLDATVFHSALIDNAAPKIRQFAGKINLVFFVGEDKRSKINVSRLLKRCMAFAKQTDIAFHIEPLKRNAHITTNPSNIPTTKE